MAIITYAVSTPAPAELVLTNAGQWYQLSSTTKPCTKIRLSAPTAMSPKGSTNSNSVLVVESVTTPTTTAGAWELPASATGLNYLLVNDARLVWLYAISAGDGVEYSVQ